MTTLFDRLKPEIKTLLEKEKESYPHKVKNILDDLKSTDYVIDITYGTVIQLQGLDGMAAVSPFDFFMDR